MQQSKRRPGASILALFLSLLSIFPFRRIFEEIPAYYQLQEGKIVYPSAHLELQTLLNMHKDIIFWSLCTSGLLLLLATIFAFRGRRGKVLAKASFASIALMALLLCYLWIRFFLLA